MNIQRFEAFDVKLVEHEGSVIVRFDGEKKRPVRIDVPDSLNEPFLKDIYGFCRGVALLVCDVMESAGLISLPDTLQERYEWINAHVEIETSIEGRTRQYPALRFDNDVILG